MYRINPGEYNQIFALPVSVVDRYIQTAGALSLKVLLYLLRNSDRQVTVEEMAKLLNVTNADIHDAANFWIANGVLLRDTDMASVPSKPSETKEIKTISHTPTRLSGRDLEEKIKASAEIRFLIAETEKALGKNLIPSEASLLVSMYDWAGMPADILLMIVSYCAQNGKNNMRTIERMALDWADKGINTHEAAETQIKYLTERNSNETLVKSAFGLFNRSLTTKEKNYIHTWMSDWHFGIDMVKMAYENCIDRTGKLSFPYINKILQSWSEQGIKTPERAQNEQKPQNKIGANRETSYDISGIERLSDNEIV